MRKAAFVLLLAGCFGPGLDVPDDPADVQLVPVWEGLDRPLLVTHDGQRTFVVQQCGLVHVVEDGGLSRWLDVGHRITCGGERGLLGLAFPPDHDHSGRFYLSYSDLHGDTVLSRWQASGGAPDPASEEVLMTAPQPAPNHNGGHIAFGPDGMLYWGLGDGGGANDQYGNAQDTGTILGAVLRLDVAPGTGYAVPTDNPFVGAPGRDEIWAYGLRNPWRFSFDGEALWIGDVGQGAWEEIDRIEGGGHNLGWPVHEGSHRRLDQQVVDHTPPVAEYPRTEGRCSVTGGHVHRGGLASLAGAYLFGDFCSGTVWTLRDGHMAVLLQTDLRISSFGTDAAGRSYVVDHAGSVHRFE